MPANYIGIDFGTSNTHVAYCNHREEGRLCPEPVRIGGAASATTCVLWREPARDEADVLAIGAQALQEWGQFEVAERRRHRFAFGFKPDLARSERARLDAWAFLRKVYQEVAEVRPGAAGRDAVVIGVPAEVGPEHRARTAEAARAAGFGQVACVEEPLGALAFHLNNGDLTPAEARRGVVVIDFGGGTLDVALVSAEGLRRPWGDPALGGRLFDDLFFQWLSDQNAPLHVEEREALVVWQHECRGLKENFSRRWQAHPDGDRMADFVGTVMVGDARKRLRNASVAEFRERARAYRPSELALSYFRQFGLPAALGGAGTIDLFDWVRRTLAQGRAAGSLRGQFSKVILTGGSSDWPFMRPLAAEVFGVDPAGGVLKSQNPETTIGAGLALYTALKARNEARQQVLRCDLPRAKEKFGRDVALRLDRFAEGAADAVLAAVMPCVEEAFWDWYRDGGSLAAVEARVEAICQEFEPRAGQALEGHWQALDTDLVRLLREHLQQFLRDHDVLKDVSRYVPESVTLRGIRAGAGETSGAIAGELSELAGTVAAMAVSIGALVVAAVKVKVILVAALSHPVVVVLLTIAALFAPLGLKRATRELAESAVRQYEFNRVTLPVMHLGLWEGKFKVLLEAGRKSAQAELQGLVRRGLEEATDERGHSVGLQAKAVATFDAVVSRVVEELGVLEQVGAAEGGQAG
jgi:hypothetical protein